MLATSGGYTHEVEVHRQITAHAASSASQLSLNFINFLQFIGEGTQWQINGPPLHTASGWMIEGMWGWNGQAGEWMRGLMRDGVGAGGGNAREGMGLSRSRVGE